MSDIPGDGTDFDNYAQVDRHAQEVETQCKVEARGMVWFVVLYVVGNDGTGRENIRCFMINFGLKESEN